MKETEVTLGGKDNLSGITKVSNLSENGPRPTEEDVDGIVLELRQGQAGRTVPALSTPGRSG